MYMDKAKTVVEYYVICNKLKDIIRTGWKDWGVKRQRVESVAEHIYGVQMLAVAMWAEYKYEIDMIKEKKYDENCFEKIRNEYKK